MSLINSIDLDKTYLVDLETRDTPPLKYQRVMSGNFLRAILLPPQSGNPVISWTETKAIEWIDVASYLVPSLLAGDHSHVTETEREQLTEFTANQVKEAKGTRHVYRLKEGVTVDDVKTGRGGIESIGYCQITNRKAGMVSVNLIVL